VGSGGIAARPGSQQMGSAVRTIQNQRGDIALAPRWHLMSEAEVAQDSSICNTTSERDDPESLTVAIGPAAWWPSGLVAFRTPCRRGRANVAPPVQPSHSMVLREQRHCLATWLILARLEHHPWCVHPQDTASGIPRCAELVLNLRIEVFSSAVSDPVGTLGIGLESEGKGSVWWRDRLGLW
jgi:hypothetical protein